MITSTRRAVLTLGVAAAGLASSASATVYLNKRICGGDTFATCAALHLDVTGTLVTFRIWNLSGNTAASYGNVTNASTVFLGIGLYNVPSNVSGFPGTFATSGPARSGDAPGNWKLKNDTLVDFLVDLGLLNRPNNWSQPVYQNGISSGCASPSALPSGVNLYQDPCADPGASTFVDWVTFQFHVTEPWNATTVGVVIRGRDLVLGPTECNTGGAPTGLPASCVTVTPEPMTMTLLATGLVGLGGLGYLRRRRRSS